MQKEIESVKLSRIDGKISMTVGLETIKEISEETVPQVHAKGTRMAYQRNGTSW